MKTYMFLVAIVLVVTTACGKKEGAVNNPFFAEYGTPFEVPPFDRIRHEHYIPAFNEGIKQTYKEIDAIVNDPAAPTFENTIVALEKSGVLLSKVSRVFYNLLGSTTNDSMQALAKQVAPMMSKLSDDIALNVKLFSRIKAIYDQKDKLNLTDEQAMVLDRYYKEFVRGGANLADAQKERFRNINEELSMLTLKFSENVLKEDNGYQLVIDSKDDLAGLPEDVIAAAAKAGTDAGKDGKWVITLHKPSWIPFLQYSAKRELREKIYTAWMNRGNNKNDFNNNSTLTQIAKLRLERANLLGFPTHAHYVLDDNMAKTPDRVYDLLNKLWTPALQKAKQEVKDMQAIIDKEGGKFKLASWDWWYYAEKVKKEKYDLDENEIRPYFQLEKVRTGAFNVATKLWGVTFKEINNVPVYQEDVKVFEVKNADGSHVGILYVDYFPRPSKRGGAWMDNFKFQEKLYGKDSRPVIVNVGNFSKPTADKPSLLSIDEVQTLFHEFGHALHGLFAGATYPKVSGTNVARDFVELPSQMMENWAFEPEVLKDYAKHYETGAVIPDALIDKIQKSDKFNQGFITTEYLAACFLDMNWYTIKEWKDIDPLKFEKDYMDKIGLIKEIIPRYRNTYFSHIFSGGYDAGYYNYIWADVLVADAFQAFKENGIFDQKTARSYRENILEKGGSEDAMKLFVKFRGREPKIEPLIAKRGLDQL